MRRRRWWLWGVLALAVAVGLWWANRVPIEPKSWLRVNLEGEYLEGELSPFARLTGRHAHTLAALLSELAKAERDERIVGVLFRVRDLEIGWGKAQDLRRALARLRERGKRTIAYVELEQYGPNLEYYVASAADEVWVAPGSHTPFVGLAAEYLFLGGLFEKLGVELEYERVGKYKTAAESFAESSMSDANREMSDAILDSIHSQFLDDIAASRKMTREELQALIDQGPSSPRELERGRLVDGAAFLDEVLERERTPPMVSLSTYARVSPADVGFEPEATFALIYGAGAVTTGGGGRATRGPEMGSDALVEAFDEASKDPAVRAIVFRIDSPGGSPLASDLIWRAVRRARDKGKPVIASLSDVAASGGYYVAAAADRIVAEPGTLTGSIGVFVIRPALGGALEKLGIHVEGLTRGRYADLLLASRPLTPETRARMKADVQQIYRQFVSRVSEGRGMDAEAVNEVGRGRVWTGAQAKERGLVDALGGLREAVLEAKAAAGLAPDADVVLVPYPAPKPLFEQVSEALQGAAVAGVDEALRGALQPGLRAAAEALAGLPTGAPLLIPPVLAEVR
jgi:protease-4